jgi:hypothetical protein
MSPLARRHRKSPHLTERFELLIQARARPLCVHAARRAHSSRRPHGRAGHRVLQRVLGTQRPHGAARPLRPPGLVRPHPPAPAETSRRMLTTGACGVQAQSKSAGDEEATDADEVCAEPSIITAAAAAAAAITLDWRSRRLSHSSSPMRAPFPCRASVLRWTMRCHPPRALG